ncbi:hypothetical protein BC828DRAFT_100672 [Blastocladiella britannica]|nr:hypothetical protein BC828DRAFT_100672 [Blastocladiella britannica]
MSAPPLGDDDLANPWADELPAAPSQHRSQPASGTASAEFVSLANLAATLPTPATPVPETAAAMHALPISPADHGSDPALPPSTFSFAAFESTLPAAAQDPTPSSAGPPAPSFGFADFDGGGFDGPTSLPPMPAAPAPEPASELTPAPAPASADAPVTSPATTAAAEEVPFSFFSSPSTTSISAPIPTAPSTHSTDGTGTGTAASAANDDDNFGDFGDFGDFATSTKITGTTDGTATVGFGDQKGDENDDDDDDFGDFDAAPATFAAPPAPIAAAAPEPVPPVLPPLPPVLLALAATGTMPMTGLYDLQAYLRAALPPQSTTHDLVPSLHVSSMVDASSDSLASLSGTITPPGAHGGLVHGGTSSPSSPSRGGQQLQQAPPPPVRRVALHPWLARAHPETYDALAQLAAAPLFDEYIASRVRWRRSRARRMILAGLDAAVDWDDRAPDDRRTGGTAANADGSTAGHPPPPISTTAAGGTGLLGSGAGGMLSRPMSAAAAGVPLPASALPENSQSLTSPTSSSAVPATHEALVELAAVTEDDMRGLSDAALAEMRGALQASVPALHAQINYYLDAKEQLQLDAEMHHKMISVLVQQAQKGYQRSKKGTPAKRSK